jgi:hypothetical protein
MAALCRNPDRCRYGMAALPEGKAAIVSHFVDQDSGGKSSGISQ